MGSILSDTGNSEMFIQVVELPFALESAPWHIAFIFKGEFPCKDKPITLGHEFSGVVVETGNSVSHVKKGDHVVVDPNK